MLALALAFGASSLAASAKTRPTNGWERRAGLDRVLKEITAQRGTRIALGCARGPDWTNLLLVGAQRTDGRLPWTPVLTELIYEYDVCQSCNVEVASELVLASRALVADCFTGGSNGVAHVLVAGIDGPEARPALLAEFSCGQTQFDLDGTSLVITSAGPRGGADYPGERHPDIRLQWTNSELAGATTADGYNFERFCQPGQYYDLDE